MENAVNLMLKGMNNQEWKINYFSIVKYEESGDEVILTLHEHLSNGISSLLVDMNMTSFEMVYNDAREAMEHIQTITFDTLKDIQSRHDYFERTKTGIRDYLNIYWTYPVQVEFTKELPDYIKSEILEKFQQFA